MEISNYFDIAIRPNCWSCAPNTTVDEYFTFGFKRGTYYNGADNYALYTEDPLPMVVCKNESLKGMGSEAGLEQGNFYCINQVNGTSLFGSPTDMNY